VTEVSRSGRAGATRAAERREITHGAAAWAVMFVEDELTRYDFCAPGEIVPSCVVGAVGPFTPVGACTGGCADTTVRTFATRAEYDAFDPQTLCAP
jgi:hypothetical protein